MTNPKLSVVIPTYNEARVIGDCIRSLLKQTYENFEIIVVDDGSSDNTFRRLSEFRISNFELLILKNKHAGPGSARNLGAKKAKGDTLVFVDADMTFDKNFLKNLVKPIISGKSKGTFSKDEYVSNWDNVWARCWNINEGWEAKKRHPKNYPDKQMVFRAILKKEFEKVGGFTPGGYTDDYSLYEKLGYFADKAPGAVFYHKNPDSLGEIFYHAKWVSKRKYKFGLTGEIIALIRASLPLSLISGFFRSLFSKVPQFLVFKIVYDLGIFVGILEKLFTNKEYK